MPRKRRRRKSNNDNGYKILLALAFLPIFIIGAVIFYYLKWQKKKLIHHDNNWRAFYKFELKPKLKIAAVASPFLLIGTYFLALDFHKAEMKRQEAVRLVKIQDSIQAAEIIAIKRAKQDSFDTYSSIAYESIDKVHLKTATNYIDSALLVFPTNYEMNLLKGEVLQRRKRYLKAYDHYQQMKISGDSEKGELYLQMGTCLLKLGERGKAISAFDKSSMFKNLVGKELYEKWNPKIRVLSHYTTLCCDGTTSSSSGTGACSHHGGVCQSRHPVYINRRKYR